MLLKTVVLKKTLVSPLGCKETKPVNPKGNQPWLFIGRTDAQALILWLPVPKSQLIGKDPDAGKDRKQEEKGLTEEEMVGWHRRFNGHELEQALGDGEGQWGLMCCSPWGHKESDMTEWLNNKNLMLERMKMRHRVFKQLPEIIRWSRILSQAGGLQMALNQGFVIFFAPLSLLCCPWKCAWLHSFSLHSVDVIWGHLRIFTVLSKSNCHRCRAWIGSLFYHKF